MMTVAFVFTAGQGGSHIFFQRNRPGVAHYPVWGTLGNWVMTRDVLLGKLRW